MPSPLTATGKPEKIASLADVASRFDAIFCDVWGVVHDGVAKHPAAEAALTAARRSGVKVVLLTNSPRPCSGVAAQLDGLGFSREAYDAIVTSGDATRLLIAEAGEPIFHLGPARDADLFEGLDVPRVEKARAGAVVATGLFDDEAETPADYAPLLEEMAARDLPMICANPDIVVHRGERLIWCAGALARDYAAIGGEVRLAGKPHAPIYRAALKALSSDGEINVLAIGDGLLTDIRGANDFGADALLITDGIHRDEFGGIDPKVDDVADTLARNDLTARFFTATLA